MFVYNVPLWKKSAYVFLSVSKRIDLRLCMSIPGSVDSWRVGALMSLADCGFCKQGLSASWPAHPCTPIQASCHPVGPSIIIISLSYNPSCFWTPFLSDRTDKSTTLQEAIEYSCEIRSRESRLNDRSISLKGGHCTEWWSFTTLVLPGNITYTALCLCTLPCSGHNRAKRKKCCPCFVDSKLNKTAWNIFQEGNLVFTGFPQFIFIIVDVQWKNTLIFFLLYKK